MTTKIKNSAAQTSVDTVAIQAKDAFEGLVKVGQEQAARQFEQALTTTKEQVEKASEQVLKGLDELTRFNKENVDAFVRSGTIVAQGAEAVSKAMAAYAQSSLEQSFATGKALLGVRNVGDLITLQTSYAKSSFDSLLTESSRLSELTVKMTQDAFGPINARFSAAVETFGKPGAP
ncbi:MAG TPA: phasin family protein [Azospirillaceae bacterium]|nr:phasin family protein [Azospirillaceae bacterium]